MASSSMSNLSGGADTSTRKRKPSESPILADVFINHRGPDVKKTLARYLYKSIRNLRIEAFLDEELEQGQNFRCAIESAIRSASVHIAIFSKGYAESEWCLDELHQMLKSNATIITIFYDVKPWELRYIEKGAYGEAFKKYRDKGRHLEKLDDWKKDLMDASEIRGHEFTKEALDRDMHILYEKVVPFVQKVVEWKKKKLHVAEHPVGLDDLVKDFDKCCARQKGEKVKMLGIYGMEGSGKTTLAKEIFNRKRDSDEYDGSCFLFAVANSELHALQSKLLNDLLPHRQHPFKFDTAEEGRAELEIKMHELREFRFLIVLDDVDHKNQLDGLLARGGLNPHGLVIVTTRDRGVLVQSDITLYEIKPMNPEHSTQLFCSHAFRDTTWNVRFKDLIDGLVKECAGSPLYLKVLGDFVHGRKRCFWELVLNDARKGLKAEVKKILKESYAKLEEPVQQMFVDAACFFIGKPQSMAIRIWDVAEGNPSATVNFDNMKGKCLVNVIHDHGAFDDAENALTMHVLHRELGREMADTLTNPRRLWRPRDLKPLVQKKFPDILSEAKIHGHRFLHSQEFRKHSRIKYFMGNSEHSPDLLWIELDLRRNNWASIHPDIPVQNVQCLRIVRGGLRRLWMKRAEPPWKLKELQLHEVELKECAESLEQLNELEKLVLWGRHDVDQKETISTSSLSNCLGNLRHLKVLVIRNLGLEGAVAFSSSTAPDRTMSSLQKLHISEEKHVRKVSIKGARCPRIESLRLESMQILDALDLSMVTTLRFLELKSCINLKLISGISHLQNLEELKIHECPEVEIDSVAGLNFLEKISIDGCLKLQHLKGIEDLKGLKCLHLSALGLGGVQKCIRELKSLPSEFTTVIGRAANGASKILNENLFSDLVVNGGGKIQINENCMPQVPHDTIQHLVGAIILCAVVDSSDDKTLQIPLPRDSIDCNIPAGEWIVTFVNKAKLDSIPAVSVGSQIKMGCIITMENGKEGNALPVLKRIVDRLCETDF